jgi:predicted metal-binding protein
MPNQDRRPVLHICITCQQGEGAKLHAALAERLAATAARGVDLQEVTCMASCSHACTAAISAPGKWCYLLGELSPWHADDLLTYAEIYAAHPSGAVLPSRRPESLRQSVVARLPAFAVSA